MAKVFVTGANGFIGSHLVEELLELGHDVTALVRPTSELSSLTPLFANTQYGARLHLVLGDVRDPTRFAPALARAEYVYHLAGVLLALSESQSRETIVDGTRKLVDQLLKERHPNFKRFVLTSSQAVTGPNPPGVDQLDETAALNPVSPYGRSKKDAEDVLHRAREAHPEFPWSIVRPGLVYGERERDLSRALFLLASHGLRARIGLGEEHFNPIYVGDLVEGMIKVAESPAAKHQTYFLVDPKPCTDTELSDAAIHAFGKRRMFPVAVAFPCSLLWLGAVICEWLSLFTRGRPLTTRDKVQYMRPRYQVVTAAKAEAQPLNWKAKVGLGAGMAATVAAWKKARDAEQHLDESLLTRLPVRSRAAMAYTVALLLGVVVEGVLVGRWYEYDPWWLVYIVILGAFGALIGTLTFVIWRKNYLLQFVVGAVVGVVGEWLNGAWLHAWTFTADAVNRLPVGTRALVVGLPAGLLLVVTTAVLRALHGRRLRIG
jgi:nucleoside-diphosphate-sugar epimerase